MAQRKERPFWQQAAIMAAIVTAVAGAGALIGYLGKGVLQGWFT